MVKREEDVDAHVADGGGHLIDAAIVVLNELDLQSPVVPKRGLELRMQVVIRENEDGVMQHHRIELVQIEVREAWLAEGVEQIDVAVRIVFESLDVSSIVLALLRC